MTRVTAKALKQLFVENLGLQGREFRLESVDDVPPVAGEIFELFLEPISTKGNSYRTRAAEGEHLVLSASRLARVLSAPAEGLAEMNGPAWLD
jgi:hypothetical protein